MDSIRAMERGDLGLVVDLLAKSFQNAALYRYFEADDEKRISFLRMIFERRVEAGFDTQEGELAFEGDKLLGVALWRAPGAVSPPDEALTEAVRRYNGAVFARWQHFHKLLFAALSAACSEPHWSLAPIAVLPDARGQGVASALLRRKFAAIDRSGAPCLLGTQDEVNTRIYARYGFQITGKTPIQLETETAPGVFCYTMVRSCPHVP